MVEWVRHGLTNPQIARSHGVSADAVKFHLANAMAKLGLSSRAEVRRWNGVSRASRLHAKEPDMSQPALGTIGQVARHVADIEAARKWYGEVLGLPHLYSFGDLAFFDCGGTRLFLSQSGAPGPESILYFRVADIRVTHAELTGRGVAFIQAPHMIHRHDDGTEEWMAFFADPDGRPLAIMSQVS